MTLDKYDASAAMVAFGEYARDQENKGFFNTAALYYRLAQRAARAAGSTENAISSDCNALRCERLGS